MLKKFDLKKKTTILSYILCEKKNSFKKIYVHMNLKKAQF